MNTADALSGIAGLEGIRWMLAGTPLRALRRELAALLTPPSRLGPSHLRLSRFSPGRKLEAFYDVHILPEGKGQQIMRPIAVAWRLDGKGRGTTELADMEVEAQRRGVSAPFQKLVADVPALKMHVEVSPIDAHYPQAVRVCDPGHVSNMIASAVWRDHVPASQYSVTYIRYRPGKRHVLCYEPQGEPKRGAIYAKLYTDGKSAKAFQLAEQIAEWLAEHGAGVTSVRPLAYIAEDGVVLYPQVLGAQLSELLQRPGQSLGRALKDIGAVLRVLHQLPKEVTGPLELHDFTAKVKEKHILTLLPSTGAKMDAVIEGAQSLLERLPSETCSFTYGDFKAEHVWVRPAGLILIDFDSCRWGDPALDIGKFLADLQFWCAVYSRQELKEAQEQFLAGYGRGIPAERLMRARLYEVVELVKLTARRLRRFENDWVYQTERLIGLAESLLNDFQSRWGSHTRERETHGSS